MMNDDGRATFSVPEAARILGIGRNQAYDAIRRGELPSLRLGRRILVPRQALEQLLVVANVSEQKRTTLRLVTGSHKVEDRKG